MSDLPRPAQRRRDMPPVPRRVEAGAGRGTAGMRTRWCSDAPPGIGQRRRSQAPAAPSLRGSCDTRGAVPVDDRENSWATTGELSETASPAEVYAISLVPVKELLEGTNETSPRQVLASGCVRCRLSLPCRDGHRIERREALSRGAMRIIIEPSANYTMRHSMTPPSAYAPGKGGRVAE